MSDAGRPVAPTRSDPVARSLSESVGGPVGRHARPHRWWTPVRVVLVLGAVVMSLAIVRSQPCLATNWSSDDARYAKMCYSDVPYLYTGRGFAEGRFPYGDTSGRWNTMEYPVGIAYVAYAVALVTQATPLTRSGPDVDVRRETPPDQFYALPGIVEEVNTYFLLTAVVMACCLLGAAWFVAGTHRGRPWDALPFVLSPVLLATALVNWDLVAVLCVAGALWAWSRDKPTLTGVLLGLGTAVKLYPLFLLGPVVLLALLRRRHLDAVTAVGSAAVAWTLAQLPALLAGSAQWRYFWQFNSDRGADWGSMWLLLSRHGISVPTPSINLWSTVVFALVCVAVALLAWKAPTTPRLAQLGFLVVTGFLLVNKVYSPQYVLWMLPLAVLAVPRWRELLIWQAGEMLYFAAIWLNLGGWLDGSVGDKAPVYDLAIIARLAAEVFLVVVVVHDVWVGRPLDPEPSGEDDAVDVGGGEAHPYGYLVADGRHR